MEKAEKLKAARKKLKEFQSHKQEPKDVSADSSEVTVSPAQQVHDSIIDSFTPSTVDLNKVIGPSASLPQISNYFDVSFDASPLQNVYPPSSNQSYNNSSGLQQQVELTQFPVRNDTFTVHSNTEETSHLASHTEQLMHHQAIRESEKSGEVLYAQDHQISQLRSELEFHRMTATNLQKNIEELNKLRQESQSNVDVVKVLVAEKSHLVDLLQKSELIVKTKIEENEELQNRLSASRYRCKQLESEIKNTSAIDHEAENKKIDAKVQEFQEFKARIELEKDDMKNLLNQKRIELEILQKNFDHLNTELHLANVKIAQLSDGTSPNEEPNQPQVHALRQEVAIKQQQITELYGIIDQVYRDKESSDNQYQNYVSHLTREMEALKESSMELTNENEVLVKREQELLKHVGDLERQIQQQMQRQKVYAEDQKDQSLSPSQEDLQKLTSQITALTESNESLKAQVRKIEAEKEENYQALMLKTEEIKNMELQVEKMQTNTPNLSQLMTDFEDKSVAASRALLQNQGLKEQLDEMQRAFITMTNDKMELTDKLYAEIHLCKEMKVRYNSMEEELQEMKDKWHYKEDEMIRLSHENTELEKKLFQQNIEIDRLRHYESKGYHGTEGILEKELENFKRMVETLTNKINILESERSQHESKHESKHDHTHEEHEGHSHHHGNNHSHEHEPEDLRCNGNHSKKDLLEEIEMLKMEKGELLKAMHDFQISKKSSELDKQTEDQLSITNGTDVPSEMNQQTLSIPKSMTPSIQTEEALEKLQSRFRRTMLEVAELTEEKQRLEHVVTQLQFETETIGEYITLYQYQRRLLKQKEHERDVQLKNLASDREKMNAKLLQLNGLIEKFVLQHTDNVELAKEATKFLDHEKDHVSPNNENENMMKLKHETAGKILEILSDIKSANSGACYASTVGIENCSCCLGKLETV